jgi:RHS repeat-associated protein
MPVYQKVSGTTYDKLGRPLSATNALNHTVRTDYVPDDTGYGPLTSKTTTAPAPKSHTTITEVDPAWGIATKTTDANGSVTEWSFDALGRLRSVWKPDRSRPMGDTASIVYVYSVNNDKETWVRTDVLRADGQSYNSTYEIFDGLLRTRQKQVPAPNGGRVISETLYDDRGLAYVSNEQVHDNNAPSGQLANTYPGSVPATTETVFDAAGRATESIFRVYDQEKWRTKTDYQGDRTAVTAAEGGTGTLTIVDARGRTVERREYNGPVPAGDDYTRTLYNYTAGGQLEKLTGPDGAIWTYGYDLRGRQEHATDPDKGRIETSYNEVDQPVSVTSTLNGTARTLITDYDELGRKIGTWDGVKDNAHQLTKFTYDSLAKGQLTASIRYVGGTTGKIYSQVFTGYDALGRPKGTKTVIAASDPLVTTAGAPQTFTTSTTYNIDGTVQSTWMPAVGGLPSEAVTHRYNSLGMLTGVDGMTDYVQNIGYSPYGEIEETRLATSTGAKQFQIINRFEDGTRRLVNTHTVDQTNTGYTRDVDYVYDPTGNVESITDNAGDRDTQCFAYDGYRRLTEAWTPASHDCTTARSASALGGPAPYWTSWTYKSGGLRDTQTEHKLTGDTKTVYGYPAVNASGSGQPHTLTTVTTDGAAKDYTYDEQGNTTKRYGRTGTAQSLTWDIEGELTHLTEGTKTTDYLYDANGELLIRRGPVKTVLYLAGQELHYDTAAKKFTAQRYYPAGDATAVRTESGLSWMVDDHHGTASMAVDAITQAITRRYSKPFGEARGTATPTWTDDKGFLGKPSDAETGLTHIGAREYDPPTGRFLSADPVLAPDDHESINGYAYANNTPVTKSDPTGLRPITACEHGCSDGNGGTYHDHLSPGPNGTWVYHSTQTYTVPVYSGGSSGVLTITVKNNAGKVSHKVSFKKGPEPKPDLKEGKKLFSEVEGYMFDELTNNARSPEVKGIQGLLRPWAWYDGLTGRSHGRDRAAALAIWGAKVCPRVCDWDHKPTLEKKFDLDEVGYYMDVPGTDYKVFYDMWSNIHYGYVGRAAGLDTESLLEGASLGDSVLVGEDDLGDQLTMQAGIDLFDRTGLGLTREQFHTTVINTVEKMYAEGANQVRKQ